MSRTSHGGRRPKTAEHPKSADAAPLPQQFVNFAFYKLDRTFLRQDEQTQRAAARELLAVFDEKPDGLILNCYSTVGIRGDVDFMLWRISSRLEDIQSLETAIRRTGIGRHLDTPYSYLSLTKRSVYLDKIDPEHDESRRRVVPGRFRYNFVYPFVKTREWYLMSQQARQGVMDEHIEVGTKYQSVKLNTTYSFGVDDQEFMLAFETDAPADFLDLVMELRHTEGSKYTERDTPIFTCVRAEPEQMIAALGVAT
jgi:chlorite dismutase